MSENLIKTVFNSKGKLVYNVDENEAITGATYYLKVNSTVTLELGVVTKVNNTWFWKRYKTSVKEWKGVEKGNTLEFVKALKKLNEGWVDNKK